MGEWKSASASGREGDPGSGLGAQQLFRQTWKGSGRKGKEEQEGSTPELPDQVIAVRCQSAAERGRGERRDMRHQSRMGQREKVSQEPTQPLGFWLPGVPGWPNIFPSPPPTPPTATTCQLSEGMRGFQRALSPTRPWLTVGKPATRGNIHQLPQSRSGQGLSLSPELGARSRDFQLLLRAGSRLVE